MSKLESMIERMNTKVCPACTHKCCGCNCEGIKKIMDEAERKTLTDKERRVYYDFMRD